ncbi:MAG: FG-GAP-like repeat-containing protein [Cyclobacteriaceae bacterium]
MKVKFVYITTILIVTMLIGELQAQSIFISNIDKASGSLNEIVTINGRGFNSDPNNLRVYFGGALATIVSASENLIEVRVPANSSYQQISVINLVNGTVATSRERFLLSYEGEDFETSNISSQNLNPTGQRGVFDLCLCDFNQDGTSDVVVTNNNAEAGQQGRISIFTNNSTVGNINLDKDDFIVDEIANADCGDLNGDGKPDLILSEGGQSLRIYVLENTTTGSNITFNISTTLQIPRAADNSIRGINRISMRDLDNDGKIDIIASNESDNVIDIFRNTTTAGSIDFEDVSFQAAIEDGVTAANLEVQDLNNDGFDDIILTPARAANIYILPNSSDIGTLSFENFIKISQPGLLVAIKSGDLNNDGFADLVALDGGIISGPQDFDDAFVFLNTTGSAGGAISFERNTTLQVNENPESLDFGDMNGDGDLDLVISSLKTGSGAGLSVLINNTTGNTLSFDYSELSTTTSSRNIRVADIDNDGRPDISFTHNVAGNSFGDLSIFLNKNCITPTVTPDESQIICANNNLILQATESNGSVYKWEASVNGGAFITILESDVSSINARSFLSPGETGNFRVTLTTEGGNCENTSNMVTLVVNGDVVTPPVPTSNGPVCPGSELILTSNVTGGSILYEWTRPDGTVETVSDPEYRIPHFTASDAGRYELVIQSGSCKSAAGTIVVGSRNLPFLRIDNERNNLLCSGQTRDLSITSFEGFTYQWKLNGTPLPGETDATISISNGGSYTVEITDETGCSEETLPTVIDTVLPPAPSIVSEDAICIDLPLSFEATSTGAAGFTLGHRWDFGDGTTATGPLVDKTYDTPGNYNVILTTFYQELSTCEESTQVTITVRADPEYPITTPNPDGFVKCPSESITLELPDNFRSYNWSTGSVTSSTQGATEDGESEATVSVEWVDDVGCTGISEETYTNYPNAELIIRSDLTIDNDTIRLEEGVNSINLSIGFGTDIDWEPEEVIEINSTNDVTVFPSTAFTNVIATGTTTNNCRETANVVIVNNFLVPRKTFSPNGDGLGFECWEILNASILDGCTVYIFDSKGTIIKEINTPFSTDNCIWDGTTEGRAAPEGVYYYALKCQDASFNRSGSILMAR